MNSLQRSEVARGARQGVSDESVLCFCGWCRGTGQGVSDESALCFCSSVILWSVFSTTVEHSSE